MNVKMYIGFKLFASYIFSMIGTLALLLITGIYNGLPLWDYVMLIVLASLQAPFIALVMTTFASNKVEGFVYMKLTGLTLAGPILALFLTDAKEFLVGIFPGFWPARLLIMELNPATYTFNASWIYFMLGMIINLMIIYVFMKLFSKKHQLQ
jgi:fluoroquinolone transport system permease protein